MRSASGDIPAQKLEDMEAMTGIGFHSFLPTASLIPFVP
jgi:hypothetical protein